MREPHHYDELALAIEPLDPDPKAGEEPQYKVRVLWSPYDGGEDTYVPPFSPEDVPELLAGLEREIFPPGTDDGARPAVTPRPARKVGETLFQTLFHGEIEEILAHSLRAAADGRRKGLRLRLVFDLRKPGTRHLAALPWELLRRRETEDDHGLLHRWPIIRHLTVRRLNNALPAKPPLRVLVALTTPEGLGPVPVADELRGIRNAWGSRWGIEVVWLDHATFPRLCEELDRGTYHILHFLGHGHFDDKTGTGYLVFEDGEIPLLVIDGRPVS